MCSTLFIQYCIYFDYKRQSDHSFKDKENQKGDEKCVGLLANVTAVHTQAQQLLLGLQQALPAPQLQMLLTELTVISQRTVSAQSLT
ncbi:Mitochondrial import receptor subunit TOM20 homolog [Lemmus lemmus]